MIKRRATIGIIVTLTAVLRSPAQAEVTACLGRSFAPAEGVTVLCSANWYFSGGVCKEQDLVHDWKIQGAKTSLPGWNIPPWEERPITIRGVELTMVDDGEQAQRVAEQAQRRSLADARANRPWWRRGRVGFHETRTHAATKRYAATRQRMAGNNYVPAVPWFE
jgi:hypothetical protein